MHARTDLPFSGWRVVLLCFLAQNLAMGFAFGSFGPLLASTEQHFGVTRTVATTGMSLILLAIGGLSPLLGGLLQKVSVRSAMIGGAALSALGYWGLALYIVLGAALELMHAIKSPVFVDAGRETTRMLLRLAHAHGTLLALVNIVYALTVAARPETARPVASASLLAALVLLPAGFLLGGVWAQGGDPGVGVTLVPVGAVAVAVFAIAVARRAK